MGSTKRTEELIVINFVEEHGSGQKLFFLLFDLTIMNSYIILSYCNSKMDHRKYCDYGSKFVRNEFKGGSSSIHPQQKNKPTNQSNDMT
jgi:hypothetical protein